MDSNRIIQIAGIIIAIPLLIYAVYNNLWAEPLPPKITPTVTVTAETAYTELEDVELQVETLEQYEDIEEEMYYDSLEYLACCVESEAGNQPLLGKQLVVDVVLNRVDSPDFPDDIFSVIKQSGQFAVVANGRINKVSPSGETWQAVTMELENRTNSDVIYFQAGGYPAYGEPYDHIGDHYFSTRK